MAAMNTEHFSATAQQFIASFDSNAHRAIDKLEHALDHTFGKLDRREHRVRDSLRKDVEASAEGSLQLQQEQPLS